MKKNLPIFMLGAAILTSGMYAQPVFAAEGDDAIVNYNEYSAVFQSSDYTADAVTTHLENVGENTYKSVSSITLEKEGTFAIQNAEGSMYFGVPMGVTLTEGNLSLTLSYFDGDIMKWYEDLDNLPMPLTVEIEGDYNLTVVYNGEKADVTFEKISENVGVDIDYADYSAVFQSPDYTINAVTTLLENVGESIYKSVTPITLEKEGTFAIQNADGSMYFGVPMGVALTEDNLSLTFSYFDGDIMKWYEDLDNLPMPLTVDVEGDYDLTVVYDGERATVTFVPVGNDPNGITAVFEENVTISVAENVVKVANITVGTDVFVYDMQGHIMGHYIASDTDMELPLSAGTYVVRIGNVATKVIL